MSEAWNFAATIRRAERRPGRPPRLAGIRGLALIIVALDGSRSRAPRNIVSIRMNGLLQIQITSFEPNCVHHGQTKREASEYVSLLAPSDVPCFSVATACRTPVSERTNGPFHHPPSASHWSEPQRLLRLHGALQSQVRFTPAHFNTGTAAAPVTVALTMRLSLLPQATCSDPSPSAPDLRSAQGVEAQEEIPWSHADYHRHASFAPCMWLGA